MIDELPEEPPESALQALFEVSRVLFRLFKLFCWPPLQSYPRLVSALSFNPPNKVNYRFVYYKHDSKLHIRLSDDLRLSSDPNVDKLIDDLVKESQPFICQTTRGNTIAGLYLRHRQPTQLCVIISHNNVTDIGIRFFFGLSFVTHINCNVVIYDYSGYGLSTGKPSEKNIYADIEAVFTYAKEHYHIRPETTILYGESIGSVPTIDLTARITFLGVILESPIYSGIDSMFGLCCDITEGCILDPFPNITKVDRIESKILLMTTRRDQLLSHRKAMIMLKRFKHKVKPFIVSGRHNECPLHRGFFTRINHFIDKDLNYKRAKPQTNTDLTELFLRAY